MNRDTSRYTIPLSIVLAGAFISVVILAKDVGGNWTNLKSFVISNKPSSAEVLNITEKPQGEPVMGEPGSGHVHTNLVMYVNGNVIDFGEDKYMMKSDLAHFENSDGLTVHTHATGVTIPSFLATLGFEMTQGCLKLDTGERLCNEGGKRLSMIVNGTEVSSFSSYEIKQGDQILVDYGSDSDNNLLLKFNNIPPVSKEFL